MNCSIGHRGYSSVHKLKCDSVEGFTVPLTLCDKDIYGHLRTYHLTADKKLKTEADLILARAGLFEDCLGEHTVCAVHRDSLGIYWRPTSKFCRYPVGDQCCLRKAHKHSTVTYDISKKLWDEQKHFVPVGSCICPKHWAVCKSKQLHKTVEPASESVIVPGPGPGPMPAADDDGIMNLDDAPESAPDDADCHSEASHADQILKDVNHQESQDFWVESSPEVSVPSSASYVVSQEDQTRKALDVFLMACNRSPVRKTMMGKWDAASDKSKSDYIKAARKVLDCAAKVLVPVQPQKLVNAVVSPPALPAQESSLIEQFVSAYNNQTRWDLQRQILSMMCDTFPLKTLQTYIPDLTEYKFCAARKHLRIFGRGVEVQQDLVCRTKVSPIQVEHFIQYVTDFFLQDLPYGEKEVKLSSGSTLTIPEAVLTSIPEHLIKQYMLYCADPEVAFQPPCSRTLRRILEACSTKYRKSLQGLNYFVAEGSRAFEDLAEICEKIAAEDVAKKWTSALQYARHHFKTQVKVEVSPESEVADHCQTLALSDPSDLAFHMSCRHDHEKRCQPCSSLPSLLQEMEKGAAAVDDDLLYLVQQSGAAVLAMKAHLMRAVHQDTPRRELLGNLDDNAALVTQDWAMKFLPRHFRETQTNWFGKRGISYHITAVQHKPSNSEMTGDSGNRTDQGAVTTSTYVHIFDHCTQDSSTVSAIMDHTVHELAGSQLTRLVYRSDNAGCYHNGYLIWASHEISNTQEIQIERYDFSESQDGKGVCDRKAGQIKSHVLRYINEGNSVLNATDLKTAIESNGGVKDCKVFVCAPVEDKAPKLSLTNITHYNNFALDKEGFLVYKAHNIGPGKFIAWKSLLKGGKKRTVPKLHIIEKPVIQPVPAVPTSVPTRMPARTPTCAKRPKKTPKTSPKEGQVEIFQCPEEGCVATFVHYGRLQRHLESEQHKTEKEKLNLHDHAKLIYQKKVNLRVGSMIKPAGSGNVCTQPTELEPGWALKQKSKNTRFTEKQKEYLTEKFNEGEKTGRKHTPDAISKAMKTAKADDGTRLFEYTEYLTSVQIQGFWKRIVCGKSKNVTCRDLHVESEVSNVTDVSRQIASDLNQYMST